MNRFRRLFILSAVLAGGILAAGGSAHAGGPGQGLFGGFGYFSVGLRQFDLSKMNSILQANRYSALPESYLTLGGGGFALARKWILGGEGVGIVERESGSQTATGKFMGGYGFFDLGRIVWKSPRAFAALMAGFGGGGLQLKIASKNYPANFSDALVGPFHSTQLSKGGFLVKLGFMGQFIVHRKRRGRCFNGMVVGVGAGYVLPLYESQWTVEEHKIGSVPESGMAGPYVRISIGGGGFCSR